MKLNSVKSQKSLRQTDSSPKNTAPISKSTLNLKSTVPCSSKSIPVEKTLNRVNSLQPFPKLDPEFYCDPQPNYFWNKEQERAKAEKKILTRQSSEKSILNFVKSDVFTKQVDVYLYNPKNNACRFRDFHTNLIEKTEINRKPPKVITPMHLKLYESTQKKVVEGPVIPRSHPSYNKRDDKYNPIISPTLRKKLDLYKTSYNFLKG